MNNAFSTGDGLGSPTSTESGTLIPTPSTSRANSISQPSSTNIPPGPLNLTSLSTTSWRQPYPSVGQFAMTESEEVVAAGPDGLFYFCRVRDHAAKPWSEPRPFPSMPVTLNESTVSGLALYSGVESGLHVYCVSDGVLHSFYRTDEDSSFLPDTSPPLAGCRVTGKPTVVGTRDKLERWSLVVPCQSGGLLHASASATYSKRPYNNSVSIKWDAVDHLATDLGIISAVSVAEVRSKRELVAVCISRGQLNVIRSSPNHDVYHMSWKWEGKTSARIIHPGEVTGNPVLITGCNDMSETQLDLLVPSAEGGIFHFVRTRSAPNDWHMVGRVAFPQNIPPAPCLSFHYRCITRGTRELYALVQTGGRLYHVKTTNDERPWHNARLNPIVQPGPFFE
ncbi:hypothetical protein F4818DRAFT_420832 [Hypoxylon cercidicola]|nr:hypothetical protein F4818DRAFT_420832 [Hypoxylon cercidicola]